MYDESCVLGGEGFLIKPEVDSSVPRGRYRTRDCAILGSAARDRDLRLATRHCA